MKNTFWCLLFYFLSQLCFGQETLPLNDNFILNKIEGANQNSVKGLQIDENGMTYVATEMGLYRYDGLTLKAVVSTQYPNIAIQRIHLILKDANTGLVYFSTNPEKAIYKISNNIIYKVGKNDPFYSTFYNAENNYGIENTKIVNKIEDYYLQKKIYLTNWNYQTLKTSNNTTYYTQKQIVLVFDKDGNMERIQRPFSTSMTLFKFNDSIILFDKGKAALLQGAKLSNTNIEVAPELAKMSSKGFVYGKENEYFFYSKGILYTIQYKNFKLSITPMIHFPYDDLSYVHYSKKFNIYFFGTSTNGLLVGKPKQFSWLQLRNEDNNNSVYSCAKGTNGIWYSSTSWAFNEKKQNIIIDYSIINPNIRFLLDYKNALYYENSNSFINIRTKKKLNSLFIKDNIKYYPPTSYTYLKKQFWYANLKNVFYLVKDSLVLDSFLASKIKNAEIYEIKDFEDHLLLATNKGVYKYKPFTKDFKSIIGLENKYARYIKIIDQNCFWVGCYGDGLYLVQNHKAFKVNDKNIDISTAHAVEEDKKGNLWITTNDGLLVVNKKEAISRTLNKEFIECYRYTVEDGFVTNEFNGGCTHPSFRDTDGSFGFPTIKGIVWFYPEKTQRYVFSGKIIIDEVKADEEVINLKNNSFKIPSKAELLSINFSYPYYYSRENLSVEYRFKDSDKWIKVQGNNFKILRTKKGRHELLMRIRTHGNLDKNIFSQSFTFDFEPRYYETIWFWTCCIFLFILLFIGSYQIGLKLNKRKEKVLNEMVNKKTAELQHSINELARTEVIILNSLNEKNILLREVHHRVKNNLQLIISMLNIQARRNNYVSIEDFIRKTENRITSMALIHQNLYQNEEFLDKINFHLYTQDLVKSISQMVENCNNTIKIEVMAQDIILNHNTAIPLGLIINELVTNSLKHAFPDGKSGTISISIKKETSKFELIIEDNGIGFDKEQVEKKSFGIILIGLLASQLRGSVQLEFTTSTKYIIAFQEING